MRHRLAAEPFEDATMLRIRSFALASLVLFCASATAQWDPPFWQSECVELHTADGQQITAISGSARSPLRAGAFVPADFAAAATGANVVEVTSQPSTWLGSLSGHPEAKWVAITNTANSGSLLLSQPFVVNSCDFTGASITFTFAADDALGDQPGSDPNPIGVYLNGSPIPGFFGAGFGAQSILQSADIASLLVPGCNRLEVYVRDFGGAPTAIMYHARICYPVCRKVETIRLRSGNGGGTVDTEVNAALLTGPVNTELTAADFATACSAPGATVLQTPPTGFLANLQDTAAKWITPTPALGMQYGLFCHPFTIDACNVTGMRIRMQVAAFQFLGSQSGAPRVGLYVNGHPVRDTHLDGQLGTTSGWLTAVVGGCDLVSGVNRLHLYVESPSLPPLVMYSATLNVYSCAQPEVVTFCSDASVTMRQGPPSMPLQATPFSLANGDFNCPTPVTTIRSPLSVWCRAAPCAQWVGASATGSPARSMLFCQTFTIANCTGSIGRATLQLDYACDDHLGDLWFGGPNPDGIYINGQPVSGTSTTTGGPGQCRTLTRNIGPLLKQGLNTFHLYCCDTQGGNSGAMWSARVSIGGCDSRNIFGGPGCAFTDLSLVASPFVLGATGTIEVGPLPPTTPLAFLLLDVAPMATPLNLAMFGAPNCALHVNPTVVSTLSGSGSASMSLSVPNWPALLGASLYAQGGTFDPTANALGIVLTPGMRIEIE